MAIDPIEDPAERIERLEHKLCSLAQEYQALAGRLDRTDSQSRSWRYALGFLVLAGVFTLMAGRAVTRGSSNVVEAERFLLRDKHGMLRAMLDVTPEDYPILAFYDRNKHNVLQIYAWHGGAVGMNVLDTDGKPRLGIGRGQDGSLGLATYDGNGHRLADLGTSRGGPTGMGLYDGNGGIRIENFVRPDGSAGLTVYDRNGKPSFQVPPP